MSKKNKYKCDWIKGRGDVDRAIVRALYTIIYAMCNAPHSRSTEDAFHASLGELQAAEEFLFNTKEKDNGS